MLLVSLIVSLLVNITQNFKNEFLKFLGRVQSGTMNRLKFAGYLGLLRMMK